MLAGARASVALGGPAPGLGPLGGRESVVQVQLPGASARDRQRSAARQSVAVPAALRGKGFPLGREELDGYVRSTGFGPAEVREAYRRFNELDSGGKGYLEYEECLAVHELRANPFAPRLCELFSDDGGGALTFPALLRLLAAFGGHTPPEVRMAWLFAVWDFDGDDLIGPADLKCGLDLVTNSGPNINETALPIRGGELTEMFTPYALEDFVQRVQAEVDPASLGITFSSFVALMNGTPDFFMYSVFASSSS